MKKTMTNTTLVTIVNTVLSSVVFLYAVNIEKRIATMEAQMAFIVKAINVRATQ